MNILYFEVGCPRATAFEFSASHLEYLLGFLQISLILLIFLESF
ncbi:MAG: hypothetical protein NVSMB14_02830 [Isosphaeraceae bacterium]